MACTVFQVAWGTATLLKQNVSLRILGGGELGGDTVSKKIKKKKRQRYFKISVGVNKNSYGFSLHEPERNLWWKVQSTATVLILVFYRTF
jgi:hypothetical protein